MIIFFDFLRFWLYLYDYIYDYIYLDNLRKKFWLSWLYSNNALMNLYLKRSFGIIPL